jgi:hypothetical protein
MGIYHRLPYLLTVCWMLGVGSSLPGDEPGGNLASAVDSSLPASGPLARLGLLPVEPAQALVSPSTEHPLTPLLEMAREASHRIKRDVQDYTCRLHKRERVDGKLLPPETIFAKVRHLTASDIPAGASVQPFSVYLRFDSPRHLCGREILYHHTGTGDPLLVRNGGTRLAFITLQLPPDCPLAMQGNRYPITEFGIQRLVERMLHLGEQELKHQECEVQVDDSQLVADRTCRRIEVRHPVRRPHFAYHLARIYVDEELQLPIRFEAYDWPADESKEPLLIEDYTYRDLRINVGLSDRDFAAEHPDYLFR